MPRLPIPRWVAVAALATVAPGALRAQQLPLALPPGGEFTALSWDTSSGLSQNSINDVLQTADQMLWVATFGGLSRFDGIDWIAYDVASAEGFPDNRILCLYEEADGTLLFGTELGAVVARKARSFEAVAKTPAGSVSCVLRRGDGVLLLGTGVDLYCCEPGGVVRPLYAKPMRHVSRLHARPGGDVLAFGLAGIHRLGADGPQRLHDTICQDVAVDAGGVLYVATDRGLLRSRDSTFEEVPADLTGIGSARGISAVLAVRSGDIWFATGQHLHRFSPDGSRAGVSLPVRVPIKSLAQDSHDGVWIGSRGDGLTRLQASEIAVREVAAGVPATMVNSVIGEGAGIWSVGTEVGLYRGREGAMAAVPGFVDRHVSGMHRDADGSLWVGFVDSVGVLRGEQLTSYRADDGANIGRVRTICRDTRGRLLVGTERGVYVLDGGALRRDAESDLLRDDMVKLIRQAADGGTWIGSPRALLRLAASGEVKAHWRLGEDLPLAEVRAIFERPNGRVWLGTYGSGFVAIGGGSLRQVGPNEGLVDAFVCAATPLGERVLVGSNRGAYLVDLADLDRIADGVAERVTCRPLLWPTGMSTEATGGVEPSAWTQDGIAAVCGIAGVWFAAPGRLSDPAPALTCHIEAVCAGDQVLEFAPNGPQLSATTDRTFVVRCSAPTFDHPQLTRYRWRLLPSEDGWSAPIRQRTFSFRVADPGDYVLEVEALTIDDRPSLEPARLNVQVIPRFFERGPLAPFLVPLVLIVAAWLAFCFGRRRSIASEVKLHQRVEDRTSQLRSAQEELEQRVADRTVELQRALGQIESDHEGRRRLERELQQLQRMESLGQLAGGIAHDFNNLLTVVLGNASLLEIEARDRPDLVELAARIREAGERGRSMTQHLLAVASQQTVRPQVIDLRKHIAAQETVLRSLLGRIARLELVLAEQPMLLRAAPSQIDQILTNLCVNARDAMPDGGVLRITATLAGGLIVLRFDDDGEGMTEDVQHRLFEPFFTTKPVGRGTGLGLATVYGITKQLKGEVTVASELGEGSCFTFTFPLADPAVELEQVQEQAYVLPTAPKVRGQLRVMLIEDEDHVRRALRQMLDNGDVQVVIEAANGGDAVQKLGEFGTAVDVVLSDVRMPGLQGLDLVAALRAVQKGLPIVFLSGYTASHSAEDSFREHGIELLGKPPDRDELLAALHRAVQSQARAR